jgi:L-threonylcarbamoyladenylate synthase
VIIRQSTESLPEVQKIILRGGVIAFRTDTFYGLGADPFNVSAIQRIKELKGREANKPILIVISDRQQISRFISGPSRPFDMLSERFWPGALTLAGKALPEVPDEITAGSGTVGLRLPDDDEVRQLVGACGGALTATSANKSHQPPARTTEEVANYFVTGIDLIVDGGPARTDQPSTIVDTTGFELKLIREGVVPWTRILNLVTDLRG